MNAEEIYRRRKQLKIEIHEQGREPRQFSSRQDIEIYQAIYSKRKASKANRPHVLLGIAGDPL